MFGLISVLGAVSALLGQNFGGWVVGLREVAALLVVGNLAPLRMQGFTGRGCQSFRCEQGAAALKLISTPEGQRRPPKARPRVGPKRVAP